MACLILKSQIIPQLQYVLHFITTTFDPMSALDDPCLKHSICHMCPPNSSNHCNPYEGLLRLFNNKEELCVMLREIMQKEKN